MENRVFDVDYLFFKTTIVGIIAVVVLVMTLFLGFSIGVHELLIYIFWIDFQGTGFYAFLFALFMGIALPIYQKFISPNYRLKHVTMEDKGIRFYLTNKELHIEYGAISRIKVLVNSGDLEDPYALVQSVNMETTKGTYVLYISNPAVLSIADDFYLDFLKRLEVSHEEGTVKYKRKVTHMRVFEFN